MSAPAKWFIFSLWIANWISNLKKLLIKVSPSLYISLLSTCTIMRWYWKSIKLERVSVQHECNLSSSLLSLPSSSSTPSLSCYISTAIHWDELHSFTRIKIQELIFAMLAPDGANAHNIERKNLQEPRVTLDIYSEPFSQQITWIYPCICWLWPYLAKIATEIIL